MNKAVLHLLVFLRYLDGAIRDYSLHRTGNIYRQGCVLFVFGHWPRRVLCSFASLLASIFHTLAYWLLSRRCDKPDNKIAPVCLLVLHNVGRYLVLFWVNTWSSLSPYCFTWHILQQRFRKHNIYNGKVKITVPTFYVLN